MSIVIESLQRDKHHRLAFSCGEESLDRFLHENASQAILKDLSRTFVAVDDTDETVILGYYTVTTCRIDPGDISEVALKKLGLPRTGIPGSLVARLAVKENFKGQGVGSLLLMDAMRRCAHVSTEVGGVAIIVHALKEDVVSWYEQYGFERLEPGSVKLFIMMATVRELVGIGEEERQAG